MWRDRRFVVVSDPHRGGLHIAAASSGLEQSILEEISDNCIELIAKDYAHPCACVYALSSDDFMVAMAMKISGNRRETRTHEIIRGVVLKGDEMNAFCRDYMSEPVMKEIFFPDSTDYDYPENWKIPVTCPDFSDTEGSPVDGMTGTAALGLYNALRQIQKKRIKVQLLVKEGTELQTLALLTCMEKLAGAGLFILANGECTMQSPDILILDSPIYQDMQRYRRMTLEQLVCMGNDASEDDKAVNAKIDSEQQKVNELLTFCLDYMSEKNISDCELYGAIDCLREEQPHLFWRFIRTLRGELFRFSDMEFFAERYMKLLYVAYKKTGRTKSPESCSQETAPYDYGGIYRFLKEKARSKRELKRMLIYMLEIQFKGCTAEFHARTVHEAARNIVDLI